MDLKRYKISIEFETWIGNVQIKTKAVHFYVQRSSKYPTNSGVGPITFDVEQLNVGGALNLKTGEFTATVDGIYHFEFRCIKDGVVARESSIYLQFRAKDPNDVKRVIYHMMRGENGQVVAGTAMSSLPSHSTGSLTASLKLRKSDVVKIHSLSSRGNLYESGAHYTQFVGWLVEEDLAAA